MNTIATCRRQGNMSRHFVSAETVNIEMPLKCPVIFSMFFHGLVHLPVNSFIMSHEVAISVCSVDFRYCIVLANVVKVRVVVPYRRSARRFACTTLITAVSSVAPAVVVSPVGGVKCATPGVRR